MGHFPPVFITSRESGSGRFFSGLWNYLEKISVYRVKRRPMQSRRAAIIEHYRELGQELTAALIEKHHGRPSLETITLARELAAAAPAPYDELLRNRFRRIVETQSCDDVQGWQASQSELRFATTEQHIGLASEIGYRLATDLALYFDGQREEYGTLGYINRKGYPGLSAKQFWQGHAPNRDLLRGRQKPFAFDPYKFAPPGARSMDALGRFTRRVVNTFRPAR
ncbi:MAG: hypothetical protein AAFQ84_07720 [Pseudomonadota bacterium]